MTIKTRVYAYLSGRPGVKCTMSEIERSIGSSTSAVKGALNQLVLHDRIKKHYPKSGGLTHWSVELDTRPEVRPLRCMTFAGSIFTPGMK